MKCPSCQKDCADDMKLCGYCGAALSGHAPTPAPPSAPSPAVPRPEEELWRGSFSGRSMAGKWILLCVWLVLLATAWFKIDFDRSRVEYQIAAAVLAGLPLGALAAKLVSRKLGLRYRLTTERLFVSQGILFRSQDEVELIRVDDLQLNQTLLERVFGVGTVVVICPSDPTSPTVILEGIANPAGVKEMIRGEVRRLRQKSITLEQI